MKTTVAIVALFASLAAASPAGSGNIPAHDPRDITSDGLWKRWCDGNPVQNPVCPYGAFWFLGVTGHLCEEAGDVSGGGRRATMILAARTLHVELAARLAAEIHLPRGQ
ncbi:hypothetical protein F5B17DRAFT_431262 [Nemania serpens]|nr:hypothetical protein F5B17DRAFT_431262 [Nemania serpens]